MASDWYEFVCVCVCVFERERERDDARERNVYTAMRTIIYNTTP